MDSQKPVVAVTGAADGIGWATARLFSKHGFRVALVDINARRAAGRAEELGADHIGFGCDVSKEQDVRGACEQFKTHFGRLDVLVNNAELVVRMFRPRSRPSKASSESSAFI